MVRDVPAVPPIFVNGPDGDVELNTWYHAAPAEAVYDTVLELDDFGLAVTPVGVAGGRGFVVAEAVLEVELTPTLFIAETRYM